tara:strand:+ start:197 stop:547 length:351 start_codon:yes stop_codon:yes gene_type:complete
MCFTRRKIKEKRKIKKTKIYPEPTYKPPTFTMDESILCSGCFQRFTLDQIKINCAGCDKFFHCKIAGTCYGDNCKEETRAGRLHRLSWCTNCVPKIPENKEKSDRTEECICQKCHP